MANSTTANAILTSDGDGTLTAETGLTYDGTTFSVTGISELSSYIKFPDTSPPDPGSDSYVNIGGEASGTTKILRIYTNSGYTDIGAKTSTFSHFDTGVSEGFFFQKSAIFDSQSTGTNLGVAAVTSFDDDFYVRRDYNDSAPTQMVLKSTSIEFWVNTSSAEFLMEADGDFHADGDVIANSTSVSDIRLKENLVELEPKESLEKLLSLQGYEFEWKHKDDGTHYGIIAQDLLEVLPHAVAEKKLPFYDGDRSESDIYKEEWKKEQGIEDDKYYTARYEEIIPVMIEGMKELNQKISKLEKEVEELKNGNKNR